MLRLLYLYIFTLVCQPCGYHCDVSKVKPEDVTRQGIEIVNNDPDQFNHFRCTVNNQNKDIDIHQNGLCSVYCYSCPSMGVPQVYSASYLKVLAME